MPNWGLVTTVKAPFDQIMAFIAWHRFIGAEEIQLFFDAPDDPSFEKLQQLQISGLQLTRCDQTWWDKRGGRPPAHQPRQTKNARAAMRRSQMPWLAHIDIDEFLVPIRPISEVLAALPLDQMQCRVEPFEAMHDPDLTDDIQTARHFRGSLKYAPPDLRRAVLGDWAAVLPEGMLSHSVGKVFFRTDVMGLAPRIHGAFFKGQRIRGTPFTPDIKLLHFHAQDRVLWEAARPRRAKVGAYKFQPDLQDLLQEGSPEEIRAFYDDTQRLTPHGTQLLQQAGRLVEIDLGLRDKVRQLLDRA